MQQYSRRADGPQVTARIARVDALPSRNSLSRRYREESSAVSAGLNAYRFAGVSGTRVSDPSIEPTSRFPTMMAGNRDRPMPASSRFRSCSSRTDPSASRQVEATVAVRSWYGRCHETSARSRAGLPSPRRSTHPLASASSAERTGSPTRASSSAARSLSPCRPAPPTRRSRRSHRPGQARRSISGAGRRDDPPARRAAPARPASARPCVPLCVPFLLPMLRHVADRYQGRRPSPGLTPGPDGASRAGGTTSTGWPPGSMSVSTSLPASGQRVPAPASTLQPFCKLQLEIF